MSIHLSLLGTAKVYLGLALHSSNCSTNKKHLKETKLTLHNITTIHVVNRECTLAWDERSVFIY